MKKFILCLVATIVSISAKAEFASLSFLFKDGSAVVISSSELEISFADGKLIATNTDGTSELTLSELESMSFSNDAPSPSNDVILIEGQDIVTLYTVDGAQLGTYLNMDDALKNVPAGIYVVKTQSGKIIKTVVK